MTLFVYKLTDGLICFLVSMKETGYMVLWNPWTHSFMHKTG